MRRHMRRRAEWRKPITKEIGSRVNSTGIQGLEILNVQLGMKTEVRMRSVEQIRVWIMFVGVYLTILLVAAAKALAVLS